MDDAAVYTKIVPLREDDAVLDPSTDRYIVTGRGSWGDDQLGDPIALLNELKCDESCRDHLLKRHDGHHFTGLKEWYKRKLASKPLRKIISSSSTSSAASMIFASLPKRPVLTSSVAAGKALVIVHRLLQQGGRECLSFCYSKLGLVRDIGNAGACQTPDPLWKLVSTYSSVLVLKSTFHHRFPGYENNYSVDAGSLDHGGESESSAVHAVSCLNKLQEGILHAADTGLVLLEECLVKDGSVACNGTVDSIQLVVGALILLLKEADLVYDITWFLLSSVQFSAEQSALRYSVFTKFEDLHKLLRLLYERARSQPAVALTTCPPSLPEQPLWSTLERTKKDDEEESFEVIGGRVGEAAAAAFQRFSEGWS